MPCHLIDAPIDDRGRIGEAVLALLELPTSAHDARRSVARDDPPGGARRLIRTSTSTTGCAGPSGSASCTAPTRARTTARISPSIPTSSTGIRACARLALGAYMSCGSRARLIGELVVMPETVRPDKLASAATYALLVRSLAADAAWLAGHEATLTEWADVLVGLVDAYIDRGAATTGDDVARRRARARDACRARSRRSRRPARRFREAREHAVRRLVGARADRGEPLAAGVDDRAAARASRRAVSRRVRGRARRGRVSARDEVSPLDLRRDAQVGPGRCLAARRRSRRVLRSAARRARAALPVVRRRGAEERRRRSARRRSCSSSPTRSRRTSAPRRAARRSSCSRCASRCIAGATRRADRGARASWAVRVRDACTRTCARVAIRFRTRTACSRCCARDHPQLAVLRRELGIVDSLPDAPPPERSASCRSRTCARSSSHRSRRGRRPCSISTSCPTTPSSITATSRFTSSDPRARFCCARCSAACSSARARSRSPKRTTPSCASSRCAASSRSACSATPRAPSICARSSAGARS